MAVISATPTRTQSSALTSLSPSRALKLLPWVALGERLVSAEDWVLVGVALITAMWKQRALHAGVTGG